jgi:hypothetical protein
VIKDARAVTQAGCCCLVTAWKEKENRTTKYLNKNKKKKNTKRVGIIDPGDIYINIFITS